MRKELDEALCRDFPHLYQDRRADMRQTAMCWGFACSDGWEPLIRRLSEKLEPLGTVAVQVKEKFGGLRFYISGGSDEVFAAIDAAEEESYHTCETCGAVGVLREDLGWVLTLCDQHYQERLLEIKKR